MLRPQEPRPLTSRDPHPIKTIASTIHTQPSAITTLPTLGNASPEHGRSHLGLGATERAKTNVCGLAHGSRRRA
jgi:hypothetical protein